MGHRSPLDSLVRLVASLAASRPSSIDSRLYVLGANAIVQVICYLDSIILFRLVLGWTRPVLQLWRRPSSNLSDDAVDVPDPLQQCRMTLGERLMNPAGKDVVLVRLEVPNQP